MRSRIVVLRALVALSLWVGAGALAPALLQEARAEQPAVGDTDPDGATRRAADALVAARDVAALEAVLARTDAILAEHPKHAGAHLVRARVLNVLERGDEAIAAVVEAARLAPADAEVRYVAGIFLARVGREDEALEHWEAAVAAEPAFLDAHYNLGQLRYLQGDFAGALAAWQAAAKLAPDDFEVHKKLVQAHHALGQDDEATRAFSALVAMWKSSKDPQVQGLHEVVVDQLEVEGRRVMAYAALDPVPTAERRLVYVYTLRVLAADGTPEFSVNVETSDVAVELGAGYILGVTDRRGHENHGQPFDTLPTYAEAKPVLLATLREELVERAAAP